MALNLGDFFVKIGADLSGFKEGMRQMSSDMQAVQKDTEDLGKGFDQLAIKVGAVSVAIGAFGGLAVKQFADVGDQLDKMSKRTGISAEFLSQLRYVAERSGTSLEGFETGMRRLQRAINDADQGMLEYQRSFQQLGLDYEAMKSLSPEDQFMAVMKALAGVTNASTRAALAQELLGRSGTQLIPMISSGVQAFEDLVAVSEEIGATWDQETAKKAADLKDSMASLKYSVQGIMVAIGEGLSPAMKGFSDLATKATSALNKMADAHPALISTISQMSMGLAGVGLLFSTLALLMPRIVSAVRQLGVAYQFLAAKIGMSRMALSAWMAGITIAIAAVVYSINKLQENAEKYRQAVEKVLSMKIERYMNAAAVAAEEYADALEDVRKQYGEWMEEQQTFAPTLMDKETERYEKELAALDKLQAVGERYYNWKLSELQKVQNKTLAALNAEQQAAQDAYKEQIRGIEDIRDARLAAIQDQLDAMDKMDISDKKTSIAARKKELAAMLEVVQTEEKRQELLQEYGDLSSQLTDIARQEKRTALEEEMASIQSQADAEKQAAQESLNTKLANIQAENEAAVAAFEESVALLQQEILAITPAKAFEWESEMTGLEDFQTQWGLDFESRRLAIETQHNTNMADIAAERLELEKDIEDKYGPLIEGWKQKIREVQTELNNLKTPSWWENFEAAFKEKQPLPIWENTEFMVKGIEGTARIIFKAFGDSWKLSGAVLDSIFGMQHGGAGVTHEPTLFLAGEAGPEPFAFGSAAVEGIGQATIVNMPINYFLGNPADADRLLEFLNSGLRRQQRANTGQATW